MKAQSIKVIGKVQGVWFRASTKRKAEELGVKGFVRNETDGSVYIEAEGTQAAMDAFQAWCHEGPTYAKVTSVHLEALELQGFKTFDILR